jgi:hypothetical protein
MEIYSRLVQRLALTGTRKTHTIKTLRRLYEERQRYERAHDR